MRKYFLNNEKLTKNIFLAGLTIMLILLGFYLRLDQFFIQILIDDEWHAIHKILNSTPDQIFKSFGHADYSIPLTLLYWFEAKYFGLSELLMRWPMMLCGILTIILFPFYVFRRFGAYYGLGFTLLLACSPILIIYSREARPYAITLFFAYVSIWLFYKYYKNCTHPVLYIFLYTLVASLAIWMHLIIAMYVFAPFVLEFIKIFMKSTSNKLSKFKKLIYLGLPSAILLMIVLIPPFLHDMASLSVKSGHDSPTIDTVFEALFLSFGTTSVVLVILFTIISFLSLPLLLKKSEIIVNIVLGFMLTLLVILIVKPAWVHVPITFLRYVLPIVPVMLLSIVEGFISFHKLMNKKNLIYITPFAILLISSGYLLTSPIWGLIKKPNSHTQHLVFSISFKQNTNVIKNILEKHPFSPFWKTLRNQPNRYKIAIAPWYFESNNWDGPIWENLSKQHIIPGYLIDLCTKKRYGEVPNNEKFNFENVSYLSDPHELKENSIDFIVYQKPKRLIITNSYGKLLDCENKLMSLYGKAIFEDELIKVYTGTRSDLTREKIDKQ